MKTYIFLLLLLILFPDSLHSQNFRIPVNYRFKNGEDGFIAFFSENITFPASSAKNGTFGNSIVMITISPDGKVNKIVIVNPIDSAIDFEVIRVIDLSRSLWKKCDTINHDQELYIQVAFAMPDFLPNLLRPESYRIKKLFPEPIIVTMVENYVKFAKSEELSEKANSCLDKGNFEEALPFVNELIKRDPFNRELYKVRIMINIRLNRPELVDQDDLKLIDFAGGFSINELSSDQV
jgi:hypothetical protein